MRQTGKGVGLVLLGLLLGGAGGWGVTQWQLQERALQLKQAQWAKDQLKSELLALQGELARADKKLQEADKNQQQIQQYQDEISGLKQQLATLQDAVRKVREQSVSQASTYPRQNPEQVMTEEEKLKPLKEELTRAKNRITELSQEREQATAANRELDDQLKLANDQRQEIDRQLAETTRQWQGLQVQLDSLRETQQRLGDELHSARAQRDELETTLQQRQKKLTEQQAQIGEVSSDLQQLAEQRASLETEMRQLNDALEQLRQQRAQDQARFQQLERQLSSEIANRDIEIEQLRNDTTVIRIGGDILFDSGSVNLSRKGKKTLDAIAQTLEQVGDRHISIDGHTDNRPIGESLLERYPSNWELSAARATSAVRYLLWANPGRIDPKRISAAGYGDTRPVADNTTDEGRKKNRRIEIRLLPRSILQTTGEPARKQPPEAGPPGNPEPAD